MGAGKLLKVLGAAVLLVAALVCGCSTRQKGNPLRISCVGDSITYGYGLADRDRTCWVALLPGLLPEGSETANYGVSGSCALADGYYPWEQTFEAHRFWEDSEDLVIVMLGTNDVFDPAWSAETFERDLGALVDKIRGKEAHPRVVLMIPPTIPQSASADKRVIEEAAPVILRIAERTDAAVINLYELTRGHPEWFGDGLHPNERANEEMAACIAEALTSL